MEQKELRVILDAQDASETAQSLGAAMDGVKQTLQDMSRAMAGSFGQAHTGIDPVADVIYGAARSFDWQPAALPDIPHLARGAVLPANKPFLAMVGEQKHGTNVEAPLSTIQEAVALVMGDYAAGQEATVAVLRDILQAVLGIEVGDEVIGRAAARYNAKMAVVRGG